jgi:hypothetical protein
MAGCNCGECGIRTNTHSCKSSTKCSSNCDDCICIRCWKSFFEPMKVKVEYEVYRRVNDNDNDDNNDYELVNIPLYQLSKTKSKSKCSSCGKEYGSIKDYNYRGRPDGGYDFYDFDKYDEDYCDECCEAYKGPTTCLCDTICEFCWKSCFQPKYIEVDYVVKKKVHGKFANINSQLFEKHESIPSCPQCGIEYESISNYDYESDREQSVQELSLTPWLKKSKERRIFRNVLDEIVQISYIPPNENNIPVLKKGGPLFVEAMNDWNKLTF